MKTYFSTFVTGTQEIIEAILKKRKSRFKIKLLLDGLVVYESDYPEREIRNFRFFNNTFLLLRRFETLEPNQKSLGKMITAITSDHNVHKELIRNLPPKRKFFKVITSLENQLTSVDRDLLKELESKILHDTDLRLSIKNPNLEFWFLLRREGNGFFGIRTTYPYGAEKHREKGELRPEIAHIMCILSEPGPKDVVLDPFAGHGAIPLERSISFPFENIIIVERDKTLFDQLKLKIKRKNVDIIYGDALNLKQIENNLIDKIITDPPWGIFKEVRISLVDFYSDMLNEFSRVLKKNGAAVVLIGRPEIFEESLQRPSQKWKILKKYPILVSGQKATIYKLGLEI